MTREAIYTSLLRLYPKSFREQYEASMTSTFSELARDHRGTPLQFWSLIARDLGRSLVREHLDAWMTGLRRQSLMWVFACVLGAMLSGAVLYLFIYAVEWLMPPRIDVFTSPDGQLHRSFYSYGRNLPTGVYGALIGLVLGAAQATALRGRIRRPIFWALGTCVVGAAGFPLGFVVANLIGDHLVGQVRMLGYWAGVLTLGGLLGGMQARLLDETWRGALRLMFWNAISIVAGLLSGLAAVILTHLNNPRQFSSLKLALVFAVMGAAAGLAIGLFSVGPLMKAIARQRITLAD